MKNHSQPFSPKPGYLTRATHLALAFSLPLFLVACAERPDDEQVNANEPGDRSDSDYLERSAEIANALQTNLGKELQAALSEGGPLAGIEVCQEVAQPLTTEISEKYPDARISRTALRVRNPANAPDEQSRAVLERWASLQAGGEELPEADRYESENSVLVHRPITTGTTCLQCHGNPANFSPALKSALAEYYPDDEATGFEEGELRGAFRIEFPK